ncbi:unnamed protein product, partial [marine sediment metagenome]
IIRLREKNRAIDNFKNDLVIDKISSFLNIFKAFYFTNLPEDTQRYYSKEVYNNGLTQELLEKIRDEIIVEKSLTKVEEKISEKLTTVSKEIEPLPTRIVKLSLKEKIAYRFIFNEKNTYKYWYNRFLFCGVDLERSRRVISRIKNFYHWCDEWS